MSRMFSSPQIWIAIIGLTLALTWIAWRRGLLFRRAWAWIMRSAYAGLIILAIFMPQNDAALASAMMRQVIVLDQSDSLSDGARQEAWQKALEWQSIGQGRMIVVYGVGASAFLANEASDATASRPIIDGRGSDLPEALQLASTLLARNPGKIILATDGLYDQSFQAEQIVGELTDAGHSVDFMALNPRPSANDIAIGELIAPPNLWSGTNFDLVVQVLGDPLASTVPLQLFVNGDISNISAEPVGGNSYRFRITDLPEGLVTLKVSAGEGSQDSDNNSSGSDPFLNNNSAYGIIQVYPPPRVLLVTSEPGSESIARFTSLLTQEGIQVEVSLPEKLPTNLEQLGAYRVIFLHNLLSSLVTQEQQVALQVFVSRLAGGLILLGGQNSYTLGGYSGTMIEPMLPVMLEPPPRSERPPLLFSLLLDRSASMNTGLSQDAQPIALAREAAMRSIETLRESDYLGVMTFSDYSTWDFPLQLLNGPPVIRQALDAVSQVQANGGTYLYQSMQDALVGIVSVPAEAPSNRHMLILTDGQSTDGTPDGFRALAEAAQAQGITISTIALGPDADTALLEEIAEAAKGRFYSVADASDLPRILISESEAARSENVQEGQTSLKVGDIGHPVLSGLTTDQLPSLSRYNALRSKAEEGAEDILVSSSFEDPILSSWQYGLGRVTAWMGDIGEQWSNPWPNDDDSIEGRFWSQVVRYSLVNPALNPTQVHVDVLPDRIQVDSAIYSAEGEPLNLVEVVFSYADAAGETKSYQMAQTAAGIYSLDLPRPDDGAYRAVVTFQDDKGNDIEAPAPFTVNPPYEWLPRGGVEGISQLQRLAEIAGTSVATPEEVFSPIEDEFIPEVGIDTWLEHLLLALVLYWPIEIAIRRRWMPWL